jgi:hypothetical protein
MALNLFPGVSRAIGVVTLLGLAGTAQAALFSFASDDDSSQFTFRGTAGSGTTFNVRNGRDPASTPVTLKIDDNNGALPTVSLNVGFVANFTGDWEGSVGVAGSQTHVYSALGSFSFVGATGAPLLTGTFNTPNAPAVMTVSGTTTAWGSAGSVFGSDTVSGIAGAVVWTATADLITLANSLGINLAQYGIAVGSSNAPDDFSFTLTDLGAATGGGPVAIDMMSRLPTAAWQSEGSFSGSAVNGIPSPGALALLGAAGAMVAARRHRR